jgi:alkylation response protein AidB-like acyl-CoA dehydrogenase
VSGTFLSAERVAFAGAIRDFTQRECGTREQRDELTDGGADSHSPALFNRLAELGWIGATIPEQLGGEGGGVTDGCVLVEELEYGLAPLFGLGVTLIVAAAVEKFGTDQQQEDVLGRICRGHPMSIAMSEPGAGSDVGALRTAARRGGSGWILEGQKTWITNAHHADTVLVVARTDRQAGKHAGISMFLVPAGAPGVEVAPIPTMGPREVNDVFLSGVELPDDALLGEEGNGWSQLMAGLNFERLIVAAWSLGVARRAFDDALAFVREREQFGRPVGSFQALRHRIADLATEIECAKLLVYDVARRADAEPARQMPREASMAKLKASEVARRAALEGMQMMGGAGYAREYEMEHLVRKALPMTIYAGTSEIQREIIGKSFGL